MPSSQTIKRYLQIQLKNKIRCPEFDNDIVSFCQEWDVSFESQMVKFYNGNGCAFDDYANVMRRKFVNTQLKRCKTIIAYYNQLSNNSNNIFH